MPWIAGAAIVGGGIVGGLLSGNAAKDAANTQADAQRYAAQLAANSSKFKPIGVSNRFGGSNFGYDQNGELNSAGYNLSPELRAQQDRLMGTSGGMLDQYQNAQRDTAGMGQGAQAMFGLGNQYLGTSPQEQAAKYYQDQQGLLSTGRDRQLAELQNNLDARGIGGLATGATGKMGAANPQLEAFFNAQRQQDLGLAAQATQGGMDYTKFGAGMLSQGGDTLKNMYSTQNAAYQPYATALGGVSSLEDLARGTFDLSTSLGAKQSTAGANAGNALMQGATNAGRYQYQAGSYSPAGTAISGIGQGAMDLYKQGMFKGNTANTGGYGTGTGGSGYAVGGDQGAMLNSQWWE